MFEKIDLEYKPKPIPSVQRGEAFWLLSLGHLTRHTPNAFTTEGYGIYEDYLREDVAGKTVCAVGDCVSGLLHLAEFYGAEKCIAVDNNMHSCVYMRGMYSKWEIINGNYFKIDWPEADIYLHKGFPEGVPIHKRANIQGVLDKFWPPQEFNQESNTDIGIKMYTIDNHRAFTELQRLDESYSNK